MSDPSPTPPAFREALSFWLKLGFISFGGPAGQIATMHRELVEGKRWVGERDFLGGLHFCMLLPGPEAQQLATYLGWRLHGTRGGIAAGSLFVLPAILVLLLLSWLYVAGGHLSWMAAIFHGLSAAVIAVVFEAVLRMGKKALSTPVAWGLALASFLAIRFGEVSFVWIVACAALVGIVAQRFIPRAFPGNGEGEEHSVQSRGNSHGPLSPGRQIRVLIVCLLLWWAPVLTVGTWLGWDSTPARQSLFFSKAALVTFGGAYAVLPYVAEKAVEEEHWLDQGEMMAGLALAETTPGPLIMVLQFVGFLGGWNHPGDLAPAVAAVLGALLTTWVTFLPCFLFIFLGAPWVERLQAAPAAGAALAAITAAVVGVILNLGVTFSLHALRGGGGAGGMDLFVAGLALGAFVALRSGKVGLLAVIGLCAIAGLARWWVL